MDPENIENVLSLLENKVSALPENAELWPEQPEHWRASLEVEWSFRMSELDALHGLYRDGKMQSRYVQRYRQLAQQIQNQLTTIRALGWILPRVPLDEDIAA